MSMVSNYHPAPWHKAEFVQAGEISYIRVGEPGPSAVFIHLTTEMLNVYERFDFLDSLVGAAQQAKDALAHEPVAAAKTGT